MLNLCNKNFTLILLVMFTLLGCGSGGGSTQSTNTIQNADSTCSLTKIADDTSFSDSYPTDIAWSGNSATVDDIARVFNNARANDSTITENLVMPTQAVWDAMDIQDRGLYLVNNERYYRGIKPYEGISLNVTAVSQAYATLLYNTGTFGHYEDDNPQTRLDRDSEIANNRDFFTYGENLYAHGSSADYIKNPIARAIYGFMYDDDVATSGSFGHRKFCLATGLNDNSGESGEEGLVGFAIAKGDAYGLYPGMYSTVVVMNAFDPSSSWNHSLTIKIPYCSVAAPAAATTSTTRFTIDNTKATVLDKTTNLMWQNALIGFGEAADGISRCNALDFAGHTDWRLANTSEAGAFQFEAVDANLTLQHPNDHCTAEVTTDGYIRTQRGAAQYGGVAGDSINFSGGAAIRCVRNN